MGKHDKTMAQLEVEMAFHQFAQTMPLIMEHHRMMAKAVRSYYESLLEAGFSESESLALAKVHGIMPPMG